MSLPSVFTNGDNSLLCSNQWMQQGSLLQSSNLTDKSSGIIVYQHDSTDMSVGH